MVQGPNSCFAVAIIGLGGIVITAILFVINGLTNGPTQDRPPEGSSVTIDDIAAKLEQEPATVRTWFDERRLNVTGFVKGKAHRADGKPVLLLAMPEERTAKVTLEPVSASRFCVVRKGARVSVHCDSVRIVGIKRPFMDLGGCSFL